jgi:hypothetical protein
MDFLYIYVLIRYMNEWIFVGDINVVHKIIKIVKDETMSEFRNGV